jgi:hypothetical protein
MRSKKSAGSPKRKNDKAIASDSIRIKMRQMSDDLERLMMMQMMKTADFDDLNGFTCLMDLLASTD